MALYLCDAACYQCLNCPSEDVSRELCYGKYPALQTGLAAWGWSLLFFLLRRGGSDLPSRLDPDAHPNLRQYHLRHRHGLVRVHGWIGNWQLSLRKNCRPREERLSLIRYARGGSGNLRISCTLALPHGATDLRDAFRIE